MTVDLLAFTLALAVLAPPAPIPALVILDGAGDFGGCSTAICRAFAEGGPDVTIIRYPWSHGYRRVVLDQIDVAHSRQAAQGVATYVQTLARERPVILLAHSAGAAVALYAAEQIPPGTLERIILLAPSVSCRYNLCPAVAGTRCGIDAFVSHHDRRELGVIMRLIGTTDRRHLPGAAGRTGFKVPTDCQPMVRHHFWTPELRTLGHDGGHYGAYAPDHLRSQVFPLFSANGTSGIRNGELGIGTEWGVKNGE